LNSLVNDRRRFTLGFLEGMGAPFRGRPSLTFCIDLGAHHQLQMIATFYRHYRSYWGTGLQQCRPICYDED
jgi:hypothetical protein